LTAAGSVLVVCLAYILYVEAFCAEIITYKKKQWGRYGRKWGEIV
jgi:hypothetical protein